MNKQTPARFERSTHTGEQCRFFFFIKRLAADCKKYTLPDRDATRGEIGQFPLPEIFKNICSC